MCVRRRVALILACTTLTSALPDMEVHKDGAQEPTPPSPSPPPPSPSPPPPMLELSGQSECRKQNANWKTCSDYFYPKNGEYRQCKWGGWQSPECAPDGFICEPKKQGTANSKCPSVCPLEISKHQCSNQGANKNTCSDYYYQDGEVYKQCEMNQIYLGRDPKCTGGGPICKLEKEDGGECFTCLPRSHAGPA